MEADVPGQIRGDIEFALQLHRWFFKHQDDKIIVVHHAGEIRMAWLEREPSRNYHVRFRVGETKFRRSLKTTSESRAQSRLQRLEENTRLVESGRLEIPPDADIATFLLSDGKLRGKLKVRRALRLGSLFEEFFNSLPEASLEKSTLNCMQIHRRHLERHLGAAWRVEHTCIEKLQAYVTKRSQEPGQRGRNVGANTIKKELVTFRTLWRWAVAREYLTCEFPSDGIRYPKETEKPPFQTWSAIEQQVKRSRPNHDQEAELWDSLFLTLPEVNEVLQHVKDRELQPFVNPMFVMAAQTGARRSELMRSRIADFDRDAVVLRERKRVRGKRSFRRVPLSGQLRDVIKTWLCHHPGGQFTFCKSQTPGSPISRDDASGYFSRTLRGSKWVRIPGWHCFRHTFISNCAMKGVDQRVIDAWVGHQTDEMRRRYRHLFPDTEQAAMQSVFS